MTYFSHLKRLKFIYFRVLTTRSLCTPSPNGFDKSSFMIKKLKDVYCHQILPLEKHYHFDKFHSPPMSDADFEANPMILLVGQYSTGKSSFIRWIALFRINLFLFILEFRTHQNSCNSLSEILLKNSMWPKSKIDGKKEQCIGVRNSTKDRFLKELLGKAIWLQKFVQ